MNETPPSRPRESRLTPAVKLHELSERDEQAVEAESRPNAALIHETIRAEGESELDRTSVSLVLSAFAAGLSMGLSLIAQGLIQARLPEAPWRDLLTALGYTTGFLVVVLGRQQLFTENTLTPVLVLLHKRQARTLWHVFRLWSLVLLANLAATWAIAFALAHGSAFSAEVQDAFREISRHAVASPFWTTALKGVFAGWLIATMVWLLPGAGSARMLIIIVVTYLVGIGEFAHVVAGSVDAFYLHEVGELGWQAYLVEFLAPTLMGNVIGGVALVAVLNYGQVAAEISE